MIKSIGKRIQDGFKKRGKVRFALSFALIGTGLFFIFSPFFPILWNSSPTTSDPSQGVHYLGKYALQEWKKFHLKNGDLQPIPKENTLVIPKIGVNDRILEGESVNTLNKGMWHRPKTSTPDKGGNTVIAGHRYMYTSGPHTLFSLDKVVQGDVILVFWEGKEYVYEVIETKVVPPTAVEIEKNTSEAILTIYTCTPLYTTLNRLVVVAKLVDV